MFSSSLATLNFHSVLVSFFFFILAQTAGRFRLPIAVKVFRVVISDLSDTTQQLHEPTSCNVTGPAAPLMSVLRDHVLHSAIFPNYAALNIPSMDLSIAPVS